MYFAINVLPLIGGRNLWTRFGKIRSIFKYSKFSNEKKICSTTYTKQVMSEVAQPLFYRLPSI